MYYFLPNKFYFSSFGGTMIRGWSSNFSVIIMNLYLDHKVLPKGLYKDYI